MKNNNMDMDFGQSGSDAVSAEVSARLAEYLEGMNSGQPVPVALLDGDEEWQRMTALLETRRGTSLAAATPADSAWQNFRVRAFDVNLAAQTAFQPSGDSLGGYVAQALAANEQAAVIESGLPVSALEAFKADPTSLEKIKGYKLNDFAALARQYGIQDNLFPRMLKWLKGLGKSLAMPQGQLGGAGMMFARDEEARGQGLSEAQLLEHLEQASSAGPTDTAAEPEEEKEHE